ncbi:nodulation protein NopC [Mesorhizobium sp. AaZ16]|uniref:nodulation protein NopC n=1 Tax=Mesorhizobium sp. AaZ16 TaxID=3402289 RepID=UPI00374F5A4A
MVTAIGSGGGNTWFSLARKPNDQPQHPSSGQPNKPVGGNDDPNRPVDGNDPVASPTISGDSQEALTELFESTLRSVAFTMVNDAMADADEALADTEEDA